VARVTVVNDYQEFLDIMRDLLAERGGHEFTGFDGDKTTFEQIAQTDPEVLIIDLRLNVDGLTGWDVLTLARAHDRMRAVPVIVCSADVAQVRQRAVEFKEIGNIHVREKPFDADEMLDLIDHLATNGSTAG
jgi:two-component system, chemotaxis family, chemotaxis protein CheY